MTLVILITAILSVAIYRLGLCDGQRVAKGEKLKNTLTVTKKQVKEEDEKIKRGIKNILDYGMEVK